MLVRDWGVRDNESIAIQGARYRFRDQGRGSSCESKGLEMMSLPVKDLRGTGSGGRFRYHQEVQLQTEGSG